MAVSYTTSPDVALGLGLRCGEALGLRWTDVGFDECENCRSVGKLQGAPCSPCGGTGQAAVLHVRQTLQLTKDGLRFLGTKTERSTRDIAVPGSLVKVLREHRKRQMAERLAAGERWREHHLMFTTSIGTPAPRCCPPEAWARRLRGRPGRRGT